MLSLRLSVTTHEDESVIDIEAPSGSTWSDLSAALGTWGFTGPFLVDGQPLDDHVPLGTPPLLDGVALSEANLPAEDSTASGAQVIPSTTLVLTCESGPQQTQSWPVPEGEHQLGRGHRLVGPDLLVSREHLTLTCTHGELCVTDVGSTGGTVLNGRELSPGQPTPWHHGERLRLGASLLRLDAVGVPPCFVNADHASPTIEDVNGTALVEGRTFEWPAAPTDANRPGVRRVAAFAPIPLALGLAIWLHAPALMAFMLCSPLVLLVSAWDDRRRRRSGAKRTAAEVSAARNHVRTEIAAALEQERRIRHLRLPPPDALAAAASGRHPPVPQGRGRPRHLRIGHGSCSSAHSLRVAGISRRLTVDEAPVAISLAPGCTFVQTQTEAQTANVLELLVANLLVLGAGAGTQTVVATPLLLERRWCWVSGGAAQTHASLNDVTPLDTTPGRSKATTGVATCVLLVDARTPGAHDYLTQLSLTDTCIVWVGDTPPPAPSAVIEIRSGYEASCHTNNNRFTVDTPPSQWFPDTTRDIRRSFRASSTGANTAGRERGTNGTDLPHQATPADIDDLPDGPLWKDRPTTRVPIGVGLGGRIVHLDLALSGPHALIAGTTGSGKSEFLLAYLHALFTLNSPEQVTALLIDYKGGATFGRLARAPHVVGLVSDLDEGLGARALTGLHAEIVRRERILADLGWASYSQAQEHGPVRDLPRLFVVVDEFRVLAEELPDFVAGLVRLASVGRSLGIHLIMATQRPGGIVTADMRANLDARIALRVRERADSCDVIGAPCAAQISRRLPGRAYLAVGGEPCVEVQTTYVSGPAASAHHERIRGRHWDGRPLQARADEDGPPTQTHTELLVAQAEKQAADLPTPHRPLLPPLPTLLPPPTSRSLGTAASRADDLPRHAVTWRQLTDREPHVRADISVEPVAWVDLPQAQCRAVVGLPHLGCLGIAGAPRSGRTSAAIRCAEVALMSGSTLWWAGSPPPSHLPAAASARDGRALADLMECLSQNTTHALLVLDGWEALEPELLGLHHGTGVEAMLRLIRDAHRHNVVIVVTGGRALLASRLSPLLDARVVLRQNDSSEYSLAGLRPRHIPRRMPPGRGLVLPHAHEIQFHLPVGSPRSSANYGSLDP